MNHAAQLRFFRATTLVYCVVCVFQCAIFASEGTNTDAQYSVRTWQTEDGLPQSSIQCVAQTEDDYLWIGTQKGLARFDGIRFTILGSANTSALTNSAITALCQSHGALWIGTGNGLSRLTRTNLSCYTEKNGLAGASIKAIFESRDGSIWIGTTKGLTRWKNRVFETFPDTAGLSHDVIRSICEDQQGHIWLATGDGLQCFDPAIAAAFRLTNGLPKIAVRSVCCDREGAIWIGSNGGLTRLKAGELKTFTKEDGLSDNIVSAIYADRLGNLWIGTYSGLNRMTTTASAANIVEIKNGGESFDLIYSFLEDREGNLWVGTRDGLARLNAQPFNTYTKRQGLTHNNAMSVFQDRAGTVWIGTWGGGLCRMDGETILDSTPTNLFNPLVLGIYQDRNANLWIGLDYNGGIYRMENRHFYRYSRNRGLFDPAARVIYEDSRERRIWVGTSAGLNALKSGGQFVRYTQSDGLADNLIRVILEDHEGNLWIGTDGGVSRRQEDHFVSYTTKNGLSHNTVFSLYEDAEHALWIGTRGGLNRLKDGVFTAYAHGDGLFSDEIFEILEDDYGWFWMTCRKGVFRVRKADLLRFDREKHSTIACHSYGKSDGLLSVNCNSTAKPGACKTQDGRLWFATTQGVCVMDPKKELRNETRPLNVAIEEIWVDKKLQLAEGPVMPSAGRGELEFRYTALAFRTPEKIRFRYRLDGVDLEWVEAGANRMAHYNNIQPGNYVFHVVACNNDGVWSHAGANVKLTLLPHFWQTRWFAAMAVFAGAGIVGGAARHLTRKRMQQKLQKLEQQHALEKERTRIAQDMHDEIGARLTEILLVSDGSPAHGEKDHAKAYAIISEVTREIRRNMDAIVWAVNPMNDTLDRTVNYICNFIVRFLGRASIRCRLDVPDELPTSPVSSEVRHNLFLAVRESMNNIVRHSKSTEVKVQLHLSPAMLVVVIEDNGTGFSTVAARNGNGLLNISKRMSSIGGVFDLKSEDGKGTIVRLELPLDRTTSASP